MEAEAAGRQPLGIAHEVLRQQVRLFRWQIARDAGLVEPGYRVLYNVGLHGGQGAPDLAQHRQPADAGIKHADGREVRLGNHFYRKLRK